MDLPFGLFCEQFCCESASPSYLKKCLEHCGVEIEGVVRKSCDFEHAVCAVVKWYEGDAVCLDIDGCLVKANSKGVLLPIGTKTPFVLCKSGQYDGVLLPLDRNDMVVELPDTCILGTSIAKDLDTSILSLSLTPDLFFCSSLMGLCKIVSSTFALPYQSVHVRDVIHEYGSDLSVRICDADFCSRYVGIIGECNSRILKWEVYRFLHMAGLQFVCSADACALFMEHYMGYPCCVYDLDLIEGSNIVFEKSKKGDILTLSCNSSITLTGDEYVLSDGLSPIALPGVCIAKRVSVTIDSRRFLWEFASYDSQMICKASREHNMLTHGAKMFSSGIHAGLVKGAISEFLGVIGAESESYRSIESGDSCSIWKSIRLSLHFVNKLLGLSLEIDQLSVMLNEMGFITTCVQEQMDVLVHVFRADVNIAEDIINQILRRNFDQIAKEQDIVSMRISSSLDDDSYIMCRCLRNACVGLGLYECLSLDIVSKAACDVFLDILGRDSYARFLSNDSNILRNSLLPSMWDNCQKNIYDGQPVIRLFEIGKAYAYTGSEYVISDKLGIICSGASNESFWDGSKVRQFDFYDLIGICSNLFSCVEVKRSNIKFLDEDQQVFLSINGSVIGFAGKINRAISPKRDVFVSEICIDGMKTLTPVYVEHVDSFPSSYRDETFNVCCKTFADIMGLMPGIDILESVRLLGIFSSEDQLVRKITFRFTYRSNEKTLLKEEVDFVHKGVIANILASINLPQGAN